MNKILIGIKPNITESEEVFGDIYEILMEELKTTDIEYADTILSASASLISDLYEGNEHQRSCIEHYKDREWEFFIAETELSFAEINAAKIRIREQLKEFSIKSDHVADNSVHISDSEEAAVREIAVLHKHI
jgi:nucleoside diphosphate kinase